jgi:RHS repeat-associated protein
MLSTDWPGGNTALAYNADGYVTGITYPNSTADAFVTNSFGQRVSQAGVSGAKTVTRAGLGVTSALLSDGQADYTPGISERRAGVSTWQHSGSKSVGRQLTAGGSVTASRNYSSWGELKSSWGAWKGPFGYGGSVGYQSDPNGLQLLGHRYYDPAAGRFLAPDPIQDGENWYAYAGNSPISFFDSNGLFRRYVYSARLFNRPTHLYAIIDKDTGEVLKYGITSNPVNKRYSEAYLDRENARIERMWTYDNRSDALQDERDLVRNYGGRLNKERWSKMQREAAAAAGGASGVFADVALAACADDAIEKCGDGGIGEEAMSWIPYIGWSVEIKRALGDFFKWIAPMSRKAIVRRYEDALSE